MKMNLTQMLKSDALSIPFHGGIDTEQNFEQRVFRVSNTDIKKIPEENANNIALRKRIQNIWFDKADGSYAKLEVFAYIKPNTFRKWMNGTRNMNRKELAKFVIGFALDMETANELFALQSHPLDFEGNRFDFIVTCSIRDKDDIEQFEKDILKYCNIEIF